MEVVEVLKRFARELKGLKVSQILPAEKIKNAYNCDGIPGNKYNYLDVCDGIGISWGPDGIIIDALLFSLVDKNSNNFIQLPIYGERREIWLGV